MATVGYKELNQSGEFVIPGFVKMSVVDKPATEARKGFHPLRKSRWNLQPSQPAKRSRLFH
jgi:DNA-binding protein HU-beta